MSLKFNLKASAVQVTLEGGAGPTDFELREMTAAARDSYLDAVGERVTIDKEGKPAGIKKFDGMQADLIARCLYDRSSGEAVTREVIQTWPSSVVASLFNEAQKINHLSGAEKPTADALKNG